jgi:aspartyl-tRNA(Asn)/glutamyl-tRNA(Gln) amidotransferase subunit C
LVEISAVKKVAHLARLHLDENSLPEFSRQFGDIITHFEEISKIDTQGVDPLVTPLPIEVRERQDIVGERTVSTEDILKNAPDRAGNLFRVPPVV